MIRCATESDWVLIEQRVDPDPLDVVSNILMKDYLMDESDEDCLPPLGSMVNQRKQIEVFSTAHLAEVEAENIGFTLDHGDVAKVF